ncbi:DegT/DnrJ/EryC1/StrS family aminotransferase [Azospirillum doebereinerae]|uniref:DegT/DnrJ/EryC1/StrS family aminotransferase n=1 Tax=Azospirillum doebereinerae TaxID=92933 RepID=A0A3S0WVI7_9PROT|nr:DegT/DnrJ/EryC1/StrS family aminotransferase [Azospirillum doebereinerae]MCG5238771.1 DegT/DnrJ/EryC1/StrS family aminotransferase [Azospirillum doebereinerae]RUQ72086.1 DegT/DnrJ/EryC1/StrS family aminotransferase [Azospirillum doebereinerae]
MSHPASTHRAPPHRPVDLLDLARQQRGIRARIDAAIARVLDQGHYVMGPEVAELERRLSAFCGARHTVSCANGTDALVLALMALGLKRGEAVVVPSFTFCATAEAVCALGGVPVFADVAEDNFTLDPASLKRAVTTARDHGLTLAGVVTVDLFGQPADYDAIEPVVRENGLWLVCDAAQAFGAVHRERPVGTIGDVTTTSFFPSKPLGCYGDGGALFTADEETAATLRSLRVHGQGTDKYDNVRIGVNSRLDTLQAAILLEKLTVFPMELDARAAVADRYDALLPAELARPALLPGATSAWAQYTVRSGARDWTMARLKERGVSSAVYYARPLHRQAAYRHYPLAGGALPATDRLAATVLSLPMHPYLTEEELLHVAASLTDHPDTARAAAE